MKSIRSFGAPLLLLSFAWVTWETMYFHGPGMDMLHPSRWLPCCRAEWVCDLIASALFIAGLACFATKGSSSEP